MSKSQILLDWHWSSFSSGRYSGLPLLLPSNPPLCTWIVLFTQFVFYDYRLYLFMNHGSIQLLCSIALCIPSKIISISKRVNVCFANRKSNSKPFSTKTASKLGSYTNVYTYAHVLTPVLNRQQNFNLILIPLSLRYANYCLGYFAWCSTNRLDTNKRARMLRIGWRTTCELLRTLA